MWMILVLDRGMVVAGMVRPHPSDALLLVLDCCSTVRKWGTTTGVGQLALTGPTEKTILDPEGEVEVSRHFIVRKIHCTEKASQKWSQKWTELTS